MGGWSVAQSLILRKIITIARMKEKGSVSLIDYYNKTERIIIEPPYTRPAWFILKLPKGKVK